MNKIVISAHDFLGRVSNGYFHIEVDGKEFATRISVVGVRVPLAGGKPVDHIIQPVGKEFVSGNLLQIFSRDQGNPAGTEEIVIHKVTAYSRPSLSQGCK